MEVHADVEVERPVGLGRHHAGIAPQLVVALVDDDEIALGLAGDVFQGLHRQRGGITEGEGLVDAKGPVDPVPLVAVLFEREEIGIARRLVLHQQFQRVPLGGHHVRQRLVTQRIFLQHQRAVAHLGHVMLVDVDGVVIGVARRAGRNMGLHVHRIHVLVFVEREGEAADRLRRVLEGVVVAEGFVLEIDVHRQNS